MPMQFLSNYNCQTPIILAKTGRMRLSDGARLAVVGGKLDTTKTVADWYDACKTYHELPVKGVSQAEFLLSDESAPKFSGTLSSAKATFSKRFYEYASGKLQPSDSKRIRAFAFPDVERKLFQYLH